MTLTTLVVMFTAESIEVDDDGRVVHRVGARDAGCRISVGNVRVSEKLAFYLG